MSELRERLAPVLLMLALSASDQADGAWSEQRIQAAVGALPRLMERHRVPGVAIALVADARVQWSSGFGFAAAGGAAVKATTVFEAASLGKPVFAEIVRAIAGARRRSLGVPLHGLVPNAALADRFTHLTPRQLLSHSSGIAYDSAADRLVVDPQFVQRWRYSGAGYALLQRALEVELDTTLETLAQRHVFQPFGMLRTTYLAASEASQQVIGHGRDGRPLTKTSVASPSAASSLRTSADDYARFLSHLMSSRRNCSRVQPVVLVDAALGLHWGLGWAVEIQAERGPVAFHWGSNPGFKSFALMDPQRRLGVVVLTNGDNGLELIGELMAALDPIDHPLFEFYMLHPDD